MGMDQEDIDRLAASMLKQQADAEAKKAADSAKAAEAQAAVDAAAAERARVEWEKGAPAREAAAAAQAERDANTAAVLGAAFGERFVDADGVEHRVAAREFGVTHTVGMGHGGETIIKTWGKDRDNSALGGWRKKV